MSRPRVIDQSKILDAAEAVVVREGAARLTLDAVASEAGISKASVIYDFKTKQALIKAVIERRFSEEEAKFDAATEKLGAVADARILGRIAATSDSPADDAQAVALHLCSALAQDAELRCMLQQSYDREIKMIEAQSPNARMGRLAFLALEGLRSLEFLGIYSWPEPTRSRILKEIEELVAGNPHSQSAEENGG
ncbi:TetR/AcrR family transcriptional regulator [Tianweitania aestuarii]|uniref:TetR/AcrR family transcriptional regulator n=1 Tax=Tianweitania aestuarii TaxID=2814886 RepID=UPI00326354FC